MYLTVRQVFERSISILEKKEKDPELDDNIGHLEIAEYQVDKLDRILASRLDKTNPVAFSKRSSTYAFKSSSKLQNHH